METVHVIEKLGFKCDKPDELDEGKSLNWERELIRKLSGKHLLVTKPPPILEKFKKQNIHHQSNFETANEDKRYTAIFGYQF